MKLLLLAIVILFNTTLPIAACAADAQSNACKKYVQTFYDWYLKKCQGVKNEDPSMEVFKNKSFAFSKELESKLKDDDAASALFPDEIVGLDYDPFLNAQDVGEKYTATNVSKVGQKFRVDVFSTFDGKKSNKPIVIPELILANGTWTFVNFIYPGERSASNEDLISALNQLKKNRPPLPKKAGKQTAPATGKH